MTCDLLRGLVQAAIASPSVHNVQPARWRIHGAVLVLLEDTGRRLRVGDPTGHDAAISLGAAAEGVAIAATAEGLSTQIERLDEPAGPLRAVARLTFTPGADADPLLPMLARRASWRGRFRAPQPADRARAAALAAEDFRLVIEPGSIDLIAARYDRASYAILRGDKFRAELRHWMRLRPGHADWARDGLNAEAMHLSPLEAQVAGAVLGPLFPPLDTIGVAPHLLAERQGFAPAAAVGLFHRPVGEDPFDSGRAFHRRWLAIDAAGFGANVLAALADHRETAAALCAEHGLGPDRRLVSAFRIGLRAGERVAPARLPLDEVLLG